jgi:pseudooxynicotine oxidase
METDVAIVGGGFAGVTAARELTMRGRSAVLVEARDRLGGRTFTEDHDGHPMELGGTWIHPLQSNVWAEINRYGIEYEVFPVPGVRQMLVTGGRIVETDDDFLTRAIAALGEFLQPGAELFPAPYSNTGNWGPDPQGYDKRSMREQINAFEVEPEIRDWVEGMCCLVAFGPLDQATISEMYRLYAESGQSPEQMLAVLGAMKILTGTRSLIEAIASQATQTDIRLNSPVRRVTQTGDGVRVELSGGDAVTARTALITLPMNVLNSVEFEPRLSETKRTAATERHVGIGRKTYVHVKGDIGNIAVLAPATEAINWAVTYHNEPHGSWMTTFSADPRRMPSEKYDDIASMQTALQRLVPGVEVDRIIGWDWANDPLALGTWLIFRPGQLERLLPGLRQTEGRLFFAGADSAPVWRSFIDGAIESGYRAAREIDRHLTG